MDMIVGPPAGNVCFFITKVIYFYVRSQNYISKCLVKFYYHLRVYFHVQMEEMKRCNHQERVRFAVFITI